MRFSCSFIRSPNGEGFRSFAPKLGVSVGTLSAIEAGKPVGAKMAAKVEDGLAALTHKS